MLCGQISWLFQVTKIIRSALSTEFGREKKVDYFKTRECSQEPEFESEQPKSPAMSSAEEVTRLLAKVEALSQTVEALNVENKDSD